MYRAARQGNRLQGGQPGDQLRLSSLSGVLHTQDRTDREGGKKGQGGDLLHGGRPTSVALHRHGDGQLGLPGAGVYDGLEDKQVSSINKICISTSIVLSIHSILMIFEYSGTRKET